MMPGIGRPLLGTVWSGGGIWARVVGAVSGSSTEASMCLGRDLWTSSTLMGTQQWGRAGLATRPGRGKQKEGGDEGEANVNVSADVAKRHKDDIDSLAAILGHVKRGKQRHLLQQMMRGPPGGGVPAQQEIDDTLGEAQKDFESSVVSIARTSKMTKAGTVFTYRSLVVLGNNKGTGGFGIGKGEEAGAATKKAELNALKNLFYVDRFNGHTIYHPTYAKLGKTRVFLKPSSSGTGLIAGENVSTICRLLGIADISSKIEGSRNDLNTVKATFMALSLIDTPKDLCESLESKLYDTI